MFVYKTKDNKTVCACACATHSARDRELQVSCNNMTHKIPHNMLHTHTHTQREIERGRQRDKHSIQRTRHATFGLLNYVAIGYLKLTLALVEPGQGRAKRNNSISAFKN